MTDRGYDIFISYAFEDSRDARWLCDVLERAGWRPFLAEREMHDVSRNSPEWSERIDRAIDESRLLMLLISPDSVASRWVDHEWRSVHKGILDGRAMPAVIIPCCVREIAPNRLDRALGDYEAVDLRDHHRRAESIQRLLGLVESFLQRPAAKGRQLIRVLSIEGGGVRSLAAGRVLVALEEKIRRVMGPSARIADCFDLVAGVSSGCSLAALIAYPDIPAEDAVARYRTHIPASFRRNHLYPLTDKYDPTALVNALTEVFGDTRLSDLALPCLIPTYDLIHRRVLLLGQHRARENPDWDMPVVDAVVAAVSVPVWFPPREVMFPNRLQALLVDGCLYARNPTDLAFEEACAMRHPRATAEDICILSIGTGRAPVSEKSPRHWTIVDWLPEMLSIAMDGAADLVHATFRRMYDTMGYSNRYLRIDLDEEATGGKIFQMDDTDAETLTELERIGDELAVRFSGELEEFVQLLLSAETASKAVG